ISSFGGGHLLDPLYSGQIVAVVDTAVDPRTSAYYEDAYLPLGIRAFVAVPCMRDDRWVAALMLHSTEPRTWPPEEVALLERAAHRTWLAVESARLYELAERDALLLRTVRDSVIVTDTEGIVTYWNEGATQLFGWEASEMLGRPHI